MKLTRAHDPLLAILALLALLGISLSLGSRLHRQPPAPAGTTQALRALELQLALGQKLEAQQPGITKRFLEGGRELRAPWDRAAWAVQAQEAGDSALAASMKSMPPGPEGQSFKAAWAAAYEDGPLPAAVPKPLAGTRAGALLENRLRARQGLPALPLPAPPLGRFVLIGALVGLLLLGGVATFIVMLATRHRPEPPQPRWRSDGRGALLVFLGWLVAFFVFNFLAGMLLKPLPGGALWAVPLGYAAHAAFGVWLILKVEGLSFGELVAQVAPRARFGKALLWAPGFVGLAALCVLIVAVAMAPALKGQANPQQEILDLIRNAKGTPLQLALFLTVAGLAPCFEELLFRGYLLSWSGPRWGAAWSLAATSLLFGFIHLQPLALPVLATLGFVLGLAVRRGGSLWTSIAVHACWNGSVFLLMRLG